MRRPLAIRLSDACLKILDRIAEDTGVANRRAAIELLARQASVAKTRAGARSYAALLLNPDAHK